MADEPNKSFATNRDLLKFGVGLGGLMAALLAFCVVRVVRKRPKTLRPE